MPYCAYTREEIRLKRESRHKRGGTKEGELEGREREKETERWRKGEGVAVIQRHTQRREKKRKEEIVDERDSKKEK